MAKPTIANAAFATDASFSSGPASGTPTKVAPSAIAAQGWRPGDALGFVGAWFNYLHNQAYLWFQYLDTINTDAEFLALTFVWTALHRFTAGVRASAIQLVTGGNIAYTDAAGAAAPRSTTRSVPWHLSSYNGVAAGWSMAGAGNLYSDVLAGGNYAGQVSVGPDVLPAGSVLQTVYGWVNDGGGTLTVDFGYYPINHATGAIGAWVSLATATTAGTGVLIGGYPNGAALAHTVNHDSRRYMFTLVGNAAGTGHTINDLYVVFDDYGFLGN